MCVCVCVCGGGGGGGGGDSKGEIAVLTASNIQERAMLGRHPKVGRPSVKHHLKLLWGCSYGDGAVVYRPLNSHYLVV